MHPQPIEEAALAGNVASECLAPRLARVQTAAADAIVIADSHRQTVYSVLLSNIVLLMHLSQHMEQGLPEDFGNLMQTAVVLRFRQHLLDVAVFLKKTPASVLVAAEEEDSNKGDGHHLGGVHFGLRRFFLSSAVQKVIAEAVNGDDLSNLALHGGPFWEWWVVLPLYQRPVRPETEKHSI